MLMPLSSALNCLGKTALKTLLAGLVVPIVLNSGLMARAQVVSLVLSNDAALKLPTYLATDGTKLFAGGTGTDGNAHIFTVPLAGGPATQLHPASGPAQLTLLGPNVFWIDANSGPYTDTQILKAAADGSGSVSAIYTGSSSGQPIVDGTGLASDASYLYAADEVAGTVWRLNPDGSGFFQIGAARYAYDFATENLNTIAIDQGIVYIASYGRNGYPPSVLSLPAGGGSYNTLASGSPLVAPLGIAVGNGKVFVTDAGNTNTVWQVPTGGGTPTAYVTSGQFKQPQGMVFLNGDLYVADSVAGAIYRISSNPSPTITSFTPLIGSAGTQVSIAGQNLSNATGVLFNGQPASIVSATATEIVTTVPAGVAKGPITVVSPGGAVTSSRNFIIHTPNSTVIGPFYPPPLGLSFGASGSANDGSIGRSSGQTWYFTNVNLSASSVLFWGATNGSVRLSFLNPVYPFPSYGSEILSWSAGLSSVSTGVSVWTGITILPGGGTPVYTRFTLRVTDLSGAALAMADAASAGLPAAVGGVQIVEPGIPFQANLKFEASYSAGSGFVPALDFYDSQYKSGAAGTAYSSFTGGFYFENTPPVFLTNPQDVVVNRGAAPETPPIQFDFTDTEVGPNYVRFYAGSTNQALLPNGAVQLSRVGNNTERVVLRPTPGQFGQSLITLYESDSYATNTRSFLLTVNDPPTISNIPDQVVNKGAPAVPVNFTIGDSESDAALLSLNRASTNLDLVPLSGIAFGGSGSNRTVTVTPAPGQTGTTRITITVLDGIGSASDSFLFTVNDLPLLAQNQPLNLLQGESAVIGSSLLSGADAESGPQRVTFTIGSGSNGGPTHEGGLTIDGTNLVAGSTFNQDDINNGRLIYSHNGTCSTNDDFQFSISDGDGGTIPTGQYTVYSFRINITQSNRPPVVADSSVGVALGGTYAGTFPGTNTDCFPQTLTFRIIQNGSLGAATLLDPHTGAFSYTATPGSTGTDTLLFQVNDGVQDALANGVFTLVISNQPPVAANAEISTRENISVTGSITVQDADQPAQTLTCRAGTPPAKGALTFPAGGSYRYEPSPGAIGDDSFTVIANDGLLDSAPATVRVFIRPNVDPGDIVFSDGLLKRVTLIDSTGAFAVLSENQLLSSPFGVAFDNDRNVLVFDQSAGLLRIDPITGNQALICGRTNFAQDPLGGPLQIAVERSGMILVADGANGIVRVNPASGVVTPFASGGNLAFPKGIAVDPANGDIYVGDLAAFFGQSSRIVRINPVTAAQTVVSSGGELMLPVGLAIAGDGLIYVADPATYAGGPNDRVTRVNPTNGVQTVLANSGLAIPMSVATAANGRLVVPNNNGSNIVWASRSPGVVSPLVSGAPMGSPTGLVVFHSQALDQPALNGSGQFTARALGEPGETYPVLSTINFLDWVPAGSISIPSGGTATYTDTVSPPSNWRFYRLVAP